jgi:hypothetical protein
MMSRSLAVAIGARWQETGWPKVVRRAPHTKYSRRCELAKEREFKDRLVAKYKNRMKILERAGSKVES